MPKLLVVDDEASVRYSFGRVFGDEQTAVVDAGTVAEGLKKFNDEQPDVVVLDLQLPDGTGLQAFEAIRASSPRTPVVFITAHGTTSTAIEAMKRGAFDYLIKPLDFDKVSGILKHAFEAARLTRIPAIVPAMEPGDPIIGRSPAMQEMSKAIGRVAPQDVSVLVTGESGVGKELVARAIYHHSKRADKPFLAINCAALPEGLIESELFGHEKGAFTGADRQRVGKFEQCDGGTLFLDEIGDMPLPAQAKVLRLIEEQRFERVGGTQTLATDVRLIAATNQDLETLIADGRFRADLYYRLRGVTLAVPALRDRGDDVIELATHFLFRFNRDLGLNLRGFDPEALALLREYRWTGNVRELQGVLKEAMLRSTGPLLLPEFLPPHVRGMQPPTRTESPTALDVAAMIEDLLKLGEGDLHEKVISQVERYLFTRVLQETRGHLGQASERLGLNRSTLRYKLRDLGIGSDREPG